jgi:exodeoxyribonuclease VII large subunit
LDVTTSGLRERAHQLNFLVKDRMTTERIHIEIGKQALRTQPISLLQMNQEQLSSKRRTHESRVKFVLLCATNILSGMKLRFMPERFRRRLQAEYDRNSNVSLQLNNRFLAALDIKQIQHRNLKDRLRIEKIRHRIFTERKSLNEKMATLKASDPQSALERGFALVHRLDGKLIRSIGDVNEKDLISTRLADGSITSEVTLKERNHE